MTKDGNVEVTEEQMVTATKNGITRRQVYYRLWQGMTMERAITKPMQEKEAFTSDYIELAETNGISYEVFRRRVKYSKWDELEAATKPVQTRAQVSSAGGKVGRGNKKNG